MGFLQVLQWSIYYYNDVSVKSVETSNWLVLVAESVGSKQSKLWKENCVDTWSHARVSQSYDSMPFGSVNKWKNGRDKCILTNMFYHTGHWINLEQQQFSSVLSLIRPTWHILTTHVHTRVHTCTPTHTLTHTRWYWQGGESKLALQTLQIH